MANEILRAKNSENNAPYRASCREYEGGGRQHFVSPPHLGLKLNVWIMHESSIKLHIIIIFMAYHWNVRLTPKALGAKAATFEADKAKRRTFIMVVFGAFVFVLLQSNLDG